MYLKLTLKEKIVQLSKVSVWERKNSTKNLKFNDILVKIMFNLECGNIKKGIVKDIWKVKI